MRRTTDAAVLWALIILPIVTLAAAWLSSQINPAYVPRYFAPVVASILLIAAFGCARAGAAGLGAFALSVVFLLNPGSVASGYKSDMRDVGGEMSRLLHPGDLVISGQPEQTPLAYRNDLCPTARQRAHDRRTAADIRAIIDHHTG